MRADGEIGKNFRIYGKCTTFNKNINFGERGSCIATNVSVKKLVSVKFWVGRHYLLALALKSHKLLLLLALF